VANCGQEVSARRCAAEARFRAGAPAKTMLLCRIRIGISDKDRRLRGGFSCEVPLNGFVGLATFAALQVTKGAESERFYRRFP
jgi:hypothetical protein